MFGRDEILGFVANFGCRIGLGGIAAGFVGFFDDKGLLPPFMQIGDEWLRLILDLHERSRQVPTSSLSPWSSITNARTASASGASTRREGLSRRIASSILASSLSSMAARANRSAPRGQPTAGRQATRQALGGLRLARPGAAVVPRVRA